MQVNVAGEIVLRVCRRNITPVVSCVSFTRQVANAEILSMSLQMEDVLRHGVIEKSVYLSVEDSEVDVRRRRLSNCRIPTVMPNDSNAGDEKYNWQHGLFAAVTVACM